MNHRQVQDLLTGYALGALETRQQEAVAKHLQSCSVCFFLAQEHVDVAARLSGGIPIAEPREDLQARVLASVADLSVPTAGRPDLVSARPFSGQWFRTQGPVLAPASIAALGVLMLGAVLTLQLMSRGDLTELRSENRELAVKVEAQRIALGTSQGDLVELRRANLALGTKLDDQGTAVATSQESLRGIRQESQAANTKLDEQKAALAVSQENLRVLRQESQALSGKVEDQGRALAASEKELKEVRQQNQALTTRINNQQIFTYLQALPVNHKFVLKPTKDAPGARGLLVSNPDKTWGAAIVLEMEPLRPGTGYQIWLEHDGKATSTGIIKEIEPQSGFGQLYITNFPQPLTKFSGVFITMEPTAGSPAPTGKPLLAAPIR